MIIAHNPISGIINNHFVKNYWGVIIVTIRLLNNKYSLLKSE